VVFLHTIEHLISMDGDIRVLHVDDDRDFL